VGRLIPPLAIFLLLVVLGLRGERGAERADLVFVNRAEISTLDPARMSWLHEFLLGAALYEGLTRYEEREGDLAVVPGAASSWEIGEEGRTYTFRLDPQARWSNGRRVRAEDFVHAWRRLVLPDTGSDYAGLLAVVRGVPEFVAWRARALRDFGADPARRGSPEGAADLWRATLERFGAVVGLSALEDGRVLRVELSRPCPYFLDLLALPPLSPVCSPEVAARESVDARTGALVTDPSWTDAGHLVSNGPMRLVSRRFKREIRLERNGHYRLVERVALRSASLVSIADGNAQVLAFRAGVVDWATDIVPAYRAAMLAGEPGRAHALPAFGTYFYNFNCRERLPDGTKNPFADARVRRAFARVIDRRGLCARVLRAGETPATTLIPPGSIAGYHSPGGLAEDVALARAELAEAGYAGGGAFPEVRLLVNAEGDHTLIAQHVAREWERTLGVRVRIVRKETRAFREDVKAGRFMVSRASWFGDYGDPMTFLEINRTGDGNNDRGFSDAGYDALLEAADGENDPRRRMDLLRLAEARLLEQAPLAPIYTHVQHHLFDPARVRGLSKHPRQWQDFTRIRVAPGDPR
jgi:oligopeptide transport system substrate-binding protein